MINLLFMSDILFHRLIVIQFGCDIHDRYIILERYIIPQTHFIQFGYNIHDQYIIHRRYIIPQAHVIQFKYVIHYQYIIHN